ncbi:IDEAL domain-containing protein [Bacillus sp. JJ722]|uniref:IDEAL domain-containing protein n=1 Tax=Bacillus sp. JJ722 TaxID=3122973 RepID=UPI002FFF9FE7
MNHEHSNTEMMKSTGLQKNSGKETFMLELYIDMMLQEALLKNEKEKLLIEIDKALDQKNEELFQHYCNELKEINKRFGT